MRRLLVANRGEIALRIARTARRMGLGTVAVYSEADRDAPYLRGFDEAVGIGGRTSAESYLRIDSLIEAARASGADAVHPGYGFLSENAAFARAVIDAGLTWIGPPPAAIDAMADKGEARRRAVALGMAVLPGFDGAYASLDELGERALAAGLPLMIKAASGGGGRGMRRVDDAAALPGALESAAREAAAAFGGDRQAAYGGMRLIVERALDDPRHVELQVFADTHGTAIHLGERDCSVQRRHQKIIEEAPCPVLDAATRRRMGEAALCIARDIGYVGAGTVEFLVDDKRRDFWFMEMNTRLQVEHPVTEALIGVDLVEWQLRIARGEPLPMSQDEALARYEAGGHAIEARLCAEDAASGFAPQSGRIVRWRAPHGVRCDDALADGSEVTPFYDSMLAKIVAHAPTRNEAIDQLAAALDRTICHGITTNRGFLARLLRSERFVAGRFGTALIARHRDDATHPSWLDALAVACIALAGPRPLAPAWRGWSSSRWFETDVPCRIDGVAVRWQAAGAQGDWRLRCGDDTQHHLRSLDDRDPQRLHARIDGRLVHAVLTRCAGSRLTLQADGHEIGVDDDRLAAASVARTAAPGALRAPMHGRLLHLCEPGSAVNTGDVLAVIEAMKIEHPLVAPGAGTVRAVHGRVGEQVAARALLVEIDPA